jgi:hypothetical protein
MRNTIRPQILRQAAFRSRSSRRLPALYNREEGETLLGILGEGLRLGFFLLQTIFRSSQERSPARKAGGDAAAGEYHDIATLDFERFRHKLESAPVPPHGGHFKLKEYAAGGDSPALPAA